MMVMASRRRRKTCSDSSGDAFAVKSSKKRPTTSARPTAQHAAAYLYQHGRVGESCHINRTIKVYPTSFNSGCAEIRFELRSRNKSLLYGFEAGLTLVDTNFLSHEDMNSLLSQSAMIEGFTAQGLKDQNTKIPCEHEYGTAQVQDTSQRVVAMCLHTGSTVNAH